MTTKLIAVSIHAPREGCDETTTTAIQPLNVSIHAPREGCDEDADRVNLGLMKFQFTHPGRGATLRDFGFTCYLIVSIHAPREGCDL